MQRRPQSGHNIGTVQMSGWSFPWSRSVLVLFPSRPGCVPDWLSVPYSAEKFYIWGFQLEILHLQFTLARTESPGFYGEIVEGVPDGVFHLENHLQQIILLLSASSCPLNISPSSHTQNERERLVGVTSVRLWRQLRWSVQHHVCLTVQAGPTRVPRLSGDWEILSELEKRQRQTASDRTTLRPGS